MKSVYKQVFDVLKSNGIEVYEPGQKKGICKSPYVVLKKGAVVEPLTVSSERPIYVIMAYVPENNYSMLETLIYDVKEVLKKIYPLVVYAGNETESFYDDDLKAHMSQIQYQGARRIRNLF